MRIISPLNQFRSLGLFHFFYGNIRVELPAIAAKEFISTFYMTFIESTLNELAINFIFNFTFYSFQNFVSYFRSLCGASEPEPSSVKLYLHTWVRDNKDFILFSGTAVYMFIYTMSSFFFFFSCGRIRRS